MIPILDNSERARRVVLFFWVLLGVTIFSYGVLFLNYSVPDFFKEVELAGYSFSPYWILSLFSLTTLLIGIAVIVAFLQWFIRAYQNLDRFGYHTRYTSGWAIAFWFIPVANIFIPYQMSKEIWYKTQQECVTQVQGHGLVRLWWLLFVLGHISIRVGENTVLRENTHTTQIWMVTAALIEMASILVTMRFVKRVAEFEALFAVYTKGDTIGQSPYVPKDNDAEEEFY